MTHLTVRYSASRLTAVRSNWFSFRHHDVKLTRSRCSSPVAESNAFSPELAAHTDIPFSTDASAAAYTPVCRRPRGSSPPFRQILLLQVFFPWACLMDSLRPAAADRAPSPACRGSRTPPIAAPVAWLPPRASPTKLGGCYRTDRWRRYRPWPAGAPVV